MSAQNPSEIELATIEKKVADTLELGKTLRQNGKVDELRGLIQDSKSLAESLSKVYFKYVSE